MAPSILKSTSTVYYWVNYKCMALKTNYIWCVLDSSQSPIFLWDFRDLYTSIELIHVLLALAASKRGHETKKHVLMGCQT